MKVKDLITKLEEFDGDTEVSITDGYKCVCYTTDNLDITLYVYGETTLVDIGIGGNEI